MLLSGRLTNPRCVHMLRLLSSALSLAVFAEHRQKPSTNPEDFWVILQSGWITLQLMRSSVPQQSPSSMYQVTTAKVLSDGWSQTPVPPSLSIQPLQREACRVPLSVGSGWGSDNCIGVVINVNTLLPPNILKIGLYLEENRILSCGASSCCMQQAWPTGTSLLAFWGTAPGPAHGLTGASARHCTILAQGE